MRLIQKPILKIDRKGNREWYLNRKRHREGGPAAEWHDGYKGWYINGKKHREGGPACEWPKGFKKWFLNGIEYTEEEYYEKTSS